MTLEDWLNLGQVYSSYVLVYFAAVPALALLTSFMHQRDAARLAPWRYLYAAYLYSVSVPGVLAIVIVAYQSMVIHTNLLQVSIVQFVPIFSMLLTWMLLRRTVELTQLPGADRLAALFVLLVLGFGTALMIERTRIFVVLWGSFYALLGLAAAAALIAYACFQKILGPSQRRLPPVAKDA